jgi:hypothetical protein
MRVILNVIVIRHQNSTWRLHSLSYIDLLGRRKEILKRNIGTYILKESMNDLSAQDQYLYHTMVKELHQNEFEMNGARKNSD